MKKHLINIIVQMIPVMIGVVLGFMISNYGENQKIKKRHAQYVELLKNEIKQNLSIIENCIPYHVQLREDFKKFEKSDNLIEDFSSYTLKGLRPGNVDRSAFETGIQSGIIQEFSLDKIQKINKLYSIQKSYTTFNISMIEALLMQKYPETESDIRGMTSNIVMNMNDVLPKEYALQEVYTLMLEEL